jgi:EAL domain-containing protein (putative c-di-GMP-specific phosphodiesterase class I)
VRTSLEHFARLKLPGQLFLNVTQTLLDSGWLGSAAALDLLHKHGLPPSRIVFELLETDDLLKDGEGLLQAQHLHSLGCSLALDDMGRGFGRFDVWQRLHPRYLKVDRAFCAGLADDPVKAAFVRSMLLMAEASRSWVVAEGVESARDLRVLHEIGVQLVQGFVLERPSTAPSHDMSAAQRRLIETGQPELYALASRGSVEQSVLGLSRPIAPVLPQARLEDVLRRFDTQPDLLSIPVVDAGGQGAGHSQPLCAGGPTLAPPCARSAGQQALRPGHERRRAATRREQQSASGQQPDCRCQLSPCHRGCSHHGKRRLPRAASGGRSAAAGQ